MKGLWVVFGIVVATIFIATIWAIGNGLTAANRFREGAAKAANEMLPQVLDGWNAAKLEEYAAPELKANVTADDLAKMMAALKKKLGDFKSVEPAKIGNFETPGTENSGGPFMVAPFTAVGHFTKGDATVELKLVRSEGKWRIGNFFVRA